MRKQSSYGITKEDGNNIDDEISATQSEESTTGVNETIHEEITAASSSQRTANLEQYHLHLAHN